MLRFLIYHRQGESLKGIVRRYRVLGPLPQKRITLGALMNRIDVLLYLYFF